MRRALKLKRTQNGARGFLQQGFEPTWITRLVSCPMARAVVFILVFASLAPAQPFGTYRIDLKSSRIEIHVFRTGLFSGLGDNHLIVLSRFSGAAEAMQGKGWEVHVVGEAGSLEVKDTNLADSSRQEVESTMLGPTQLDVARFPTIELRSRAVLPGAAARTLRLLGDVTVHGVTRREEFPIAWTENTGRIQAVGKKQLRLRDFNIEPIRKFMGTIQVQNEFELVYDLTLQRAP